MMTNGFFRAKIGHTGRRKYSFSGKTGDVSLCAPARAHNSVSIIAVQTENRNKFIKFFTTGDMQL